MRTRYSVYASGAADKYRMSYFWPFSIQQATLRSTTLVLMPGSFGASALFEWGIFVSACRHILYGQGPNPSRGSGPHLPPPSPYRLEKIRHMGHCA
jgi:hypothetical protein